MKKIFILSLLIVISFNSNAQENWDTDSLALDSRNKADIVLSKLDSIKGMKILFSNEIISHSRKKYRGYYLIFNNNNIYKEYVVITDSISNILHIKNIDKEGQLKMLQQQKKLNRLQKKELKRLIDDRKTIQKAFNQNLYSTGFVTSVPNPKFIYGTLSYFVMKDECNRRYGEYCLPFMVFPLPISSDLWVYLARELIHATANVNY